MIKLVRFGALSACLLLSLGVFGCIDRGSPIFKKVSNQEDERWTRSTEKLISSSERLQKLDAVCRDLPYFSETNPARKGASRKNDALYYHYRLEVDFERVKELVIKHLVGDGWVQTKTEYGLWENQIEFEKDTYWIQVSNGNFGESNYATNCQDKSIVN
jgi:hypothetical protein